MIVLTDKDTGKYLGSISEEDLEFLIDNLEEESDEDTDYYLNKAAYELLAAEGASDALLAVLKKAFSDKDEVEIVWTKD